MKTFRRKWISTLILLTFTWTFILVPSYPAAALEQYALNLLKVISVMLSPGEAFAQDDYTINRIPGNFVDISDSGIQVSPALADDGLASGIPVGFDFEYFGAIFKQVVITANGYLGFYSVSLPNNIPISSVTLPNGFIAPFWDDLNPSLNPDAAIYYQTLGTAPLRRFVVQWNDVPLDADPGSRLTFEAVLFEGTNEIQFHYLYLVDGTGSTGSGRVSGLSATIGIEASDGLRGYEIAFNKEGAVSEDIAFSFTGGGNAFVAQRRLGDLDGDGQVTILDQSMLTDLIIEWDLPHTSMELLLADVSPKLGSSGLAFGDGLVDELDHALIFEVLMGRENLNPTLAAVSASLAAPGESLTIFGSGFDAVAANNTVVFVQPDGGEVLAVANAVNAAGTELTVTVPVGTYYISVRVESDGLPSNAQAFALEGVPVIVNLTPDFGEQSDVVRIRGYEFGPTPLDNQVSFNGLSAFVNSVGTTNGYEELIVTVPENADSGPVTVTVASQTSNEMPFGYDGPPVVVFDTPAEAGEITAPTEIIGTAYDRTLVSYTLEYAPLGGDFTILAEGQSNITNGVLGKIDPSLAENGIYQLRLSAADESGNSSSITRDVLIAGHLKVGINRIMFTDLQVPVSGIPITVRRTYDSRVKTKKDFGVGWSVDVLGVELQENRVPGEGWYAVNTGSMLPNWELRSEKTHLVLVRFPDGRTDVFEVKAYFDNPVLGTGDTAHVTYEPRPGTTSSLQAVAGDYQYFSEGDGTLIDWITYELYDPQEYILTTKDGTRLHISQQDGLKSLKDLNGNELTITSSGITHSSGKTITFYRDTQGRITYIYDPMNRYIRYTYDAQGDLTSVVNRTYNTTRYVYDNDHNLIEIIDPRSVQALVAEYDDDGRLVATRDAAGNRVELTHDLESYTSVVQDRLGNSTTYVYNERGDVLSQTDPLGNTTTYTYDANGNQLSETDPLGRVTTWTYDENNNKLSETDPLGNVTTWTYNDQSKLLTATDPLGHTTTYTYDTAGNLTSRTDPTGCVMTYTYDASGNRLSETDCSGYVTSFEYDSSGNKTLELDALGNATTFAYDANGNPTAETKTRTTATGPVTLTTTKQYDGEGRLTTTIDPDGNFTSTTYNSIGKKSQEYDKNGNLTQYEYDDLGNETKTTFPNGLTLTKTYDANGNMATSTDRAGLSTSLEYSPAGYGGLGERQANRLSRITNPEGGVKSFEYDAAGKMTATIDENGNRASYEYDAAGRRTRITDALGNATTYTYDANGNQLTMTDANGNTTSYTYDELNRLITTTYPDGTTTTVTYVAGNCRQCKDKKASETDQAGNTTQFEYDPQGRLTRVTDALGGQTTYTYDEVGNRLTQTDANGNTTRFAYDNLGRVTQRTLPLGQSESFTYDANGNMLSKTDFNGDTTDYTYDSFNRLVGKDYPDGSFVAFTYTANGRRQTVTDSRGQTAYTYDAMNRQISVAHPDGTSIAYTYDTLGNRTSVTVPSGTTTYTYDALNRLASVTDPDGQTTTYAYDSVGNRSQVTYPNGTRATYTYSALNRLTSLENRKSTGEMISSYAYTLGPAGNRLQVTEHSGRVVNYSYDSLYRLIQEQILDAALGNNTIAYTYDAAGNRLTKTDAADTINYTYNANDQLLTETGTSYSANYTYGSNGNTISRSDGVETTTYSYDYENRLISAQTASSTTSYAYDADGVRMQSDTDGDITHFLVDKNRPYAQVLEEKDGSDNLMVSYIYGDDLISQNRSGSKSYYHYDGQMSTRQLTDASEAATGNYVYDAFGILIDQAGSTQNNYLYAGEQYDPNIGFYYLRARYYEQDNGRFLTHDPFIGSQFEPVSLHRYLYANANPIAYYDFTGMLSMTQVLGAITIIGVLASVARVAQGHLFQSGLPPMSWEGEMHSLQGSFEGIAAGGSIVTLTSECYMGTQRTERYYVILFGISVGILPIGMSISDVRMLTPGSNEIDRYQFMPTFSLMSATIGNLLLHSIGYSKMFMGFGYTPWVPLELRLPRGRELLPSVGWGVDGPGLGMLTGVSLPVFSRLYDTCIER